MSALEAFAVTGQLEDVARVLRDLLKPHQVAELVSVLEGATTQRQSGMEKRHESWVLAVLNFLNGMDIPVWNHDARGNRLPGDKDIPERLKLLQEKILQTASREREARRQAEDLKSQNRVLETQIAGYQKLLGDLGERIIEVCPEVLDRFKPKAQEETTPPAALPRDPTG